MTRIILYDWRYDKSALYYSSLPYERFIKAQNEIVRQRAEQELIHDILILTHHPPTITLGARSLKEQLAHIHTFPYDMWGDDEIHQLSDEQALRRAVFHLERFHGIHLVKTNRGGSVWYHDHGVLQLYFIAEVPSFGISDIIYPLEDVLIRTLADLDINATRMNESVRRENNSFIGVWVGEKKIAAIGIRIERKYGRCVSMFGASLNINPSMPACRMINPCGIPKRKMTSVAEELGTQQGMQDAMLMPIIYKHMASVFGTTIIL